MVVPKALFDNVTFFYLFQLTVVGSSQSLVKEAEWTTNQISDLPYTLTYDIVDINYHLVKEKLRYFII